MKSSTLFLIGCIIAGAIALTYKKVNQLQETFFKLAIAPLKIKNFKIVTILPISFQNLFGVYEAHFDLDVIIKNNTANDFFVTGSLFATLKRIQINYKGVTIGNADVFITEISVPAYGSMVIPNIPVIVPMNGLINNLQNIPDMMANFTIIAFVDVAGTEYQIG